MWTHRPWYLGRLSNGKLLIPLSHLPLIPPFFRMWPVLSVSRSMFTDTASPCANYSYQNVLLLLKFFQLEFRSEGIETVLLSLGFKFLNDKCLPQKSRQDQLVFIVATELQRETWDTCTFYFYHLVHLDLPKTYHPLSSIKNIPRIII